VRDAISIPTAPTKHCMTHWKTQDTLSKNENVAPSASLYLFL
jgi:hypothetical protein